MNDIARGRRAPILVLAVLSALFAGCESPRPEASVSPVTSQDGLPLTSVFVYEEKVHASDEPFSLADSFWAYIYPSAAGAFRESRPCSSRLEAVQSDAEVIVVAESLVYGSAERFTIALSLRVMDRAQKTVCRAKIHQTAVEKTSVAVSFTGMGAALRDEMRGNDALARHAGGKAK